jgi:hypothetical protein
LNFTGAFPQCSYMDNHRDNLIERHSRRVVLTAI